LYKLDFLSPLDLHCVCVCVLFCFVVLEVEPRAFRILRKHSTTELWPQPMCYIFETVFPLPSFFFSFALFQTVGFLLFMSSSI
jgi:hypothetical protein